MRINQFVAQASGLSRRAADQAIAKGRVKVDDALATVGQSIEGTEQVTLDGVPLHIAYQTILLNKPVGYVCSRDGQGSKTIYDLLPYELHQLKPIGRLDKDSSGLLLLTNDGALANRLSHPSFVKTKVYEVDLDRALEKGAEQAIANGVQLEDGPSALSLKPIGDTRKEWQVSMHEGRNRQIRRTFDALGYRVTTLHREKFGPYQLGELQIGQFQVITENDARSGR